jgi:hypothetical protein
MEGFPGTLSLPLQAFPGACSGTFSDTLAMPSLNVRRVDVGIDFLMLETAVGPNEV